MISVILQVNKMWSNDHIIYFEYIYIYIKHKILIDDTNSSRMVNGFKEIKCFRMKVLSFIHYM